MGSESHSHFDELTNEIKYSETPITFCIREVFENNYQEEMAEKLKSTVKELNDEKEKLISVNFKPLVNSINELENIRGECSQLKESLLNVDNVVDEITNNYRNKLDQLINLRKAQLNIEESIQLFAKCIPALDLLEKIDAEIDKKCFSASMDCFHKLDGLIGTIKNPVLGDFLKTKIERTRGILIEKVKEDILKFLQLAKASSPNIGEKFIDCLKSKTDFIARGEILIFQSSLSSDAFEILDFSAIHRYDHLFNTFREDIHIQKNIYMIERIQQSRMMLEWSNNVSQGRERLEKFYKYLNGVIGFFAVDIYLIQSNITLVSRNQLTDIFEKFATDLQSYVKSEILKVTEIETLVQIKTILFDLSMAFEHLGFCVSALDSSFEIINSSYSSIFSKSLESYLNQIIKEHAGVSMQVEDKESEQLIFSQIPAEFFATGKYPRQYRFSRMIPEVINMVLEMIKNANVLYQEVSQSDQELQTMIRSSVDSFFSGIFYGTLKEKIQEVHLKHQELSQYYHDFMQFIRFSQLIEERASIAIDGRKFPSPVTSLLFEGVMKNLMVDVETEIIAGLKSKIDHLYSFANLLKLTEKFSGKPNDYVEELTAYLSCIFINLFDLPEEAQSRIFSEVVQFISTKMMENLLKNELHLNFLFIQNYFVDANFFLEFIKSQKFKCIEDPTVMKILHEVKCLLYVIVENKIADFIESYASRQEKEFLDPLYVHVKPRILASIIQRLDENESNKKKKDIKNTFTSIFTKEKSQKSSLELYHQRLLELDQNSTKK